jgi:glutathione S-transferase
VIELHQFRSTWGINPSPFCLKAETFCRLSGIPYKAVSTVSFKAPRGKLPYIIDDGKLIPDSAHIIDHLKAKTGIDIDAGLDTRELAKGHLLRRTCEESLYFVLVYSRWIDEAGWAVAAPQFFRGLPFLVRAVIPGRIRKKVRTQLFYQGYGRHRSDEIFALGKADLTAIATLLSDHIFAVANRPSSFDATLYALLKNILHPPLDSPLKQAAQALPILSEYVKRIEDFMDAQKS